MDIQDLLLDLLTTFYNATDVHLCLLDKDGQLLHAFGETFPFCKNFAKICGSSSLCQKAHLHACQHAIGISEGYFFSCPAGLIHFAVPVFENGEPVKYVLAGPVSLEYPDISMIDEIIQKYNLSINYRTILFASYINIPIIEPYKVRYLCKLLFTSVTNLVDSAQHQSLEKLSVQSEQQAKISEYIQLIKEDPSTSLSQYEIEKQLIADVLTGNQENAKSLLNEILGRIYFTSGNNLELIKIRSIELAALLSRAVIEGGGSEETVYQMTDTYMHQMADIKDLTALSFLLLEIIDEFTNLAFTQHLMNQNPAIINAMQYINNHYCNNLTLEEVSSHVGLNPHYFTTLFKKELKINFSSYVLDKRIERAKYLLKSSNMPLVEIALSLGFANQSYFSSIFRKKTNMTPKEYRNTSSAS